MYVFRSSKKDVGLSVHIQYMKSMHGSERMVRLSVYMQDMHSSEEDGGVECTYLGRSMHSSEEDARLSVYVQKYAQ